MTKTGNTNREPSSAKSRKASTRPKKDPDGLHSGHRERLKKRFLETGFAGFNQHQIIELLLFYAYPRVDTNDKAHELINRFGNIPGILNASYEELTKDGLLTESAATLIKLILGIIPIYCSTENTGMSYDDSEKLKILFEPRFIGVSNEELHLACFDQQLRLTDYHVISRGGLTDSKVDVRKLVEATIASSSANIAIAHNHPNAYPEPSSEDIHFTRNLLMVLDIMKINLLDHIVVGEKSSLSIRHTKYSPFAN